MEHTESPHMKSVHILRPRFEASPYLMTNIQSLLNEERRHTTPLEFYGTHQTAIDLYEYNNYVHGHTIHEVEDAFINSKRIIRLSRQIKFHQISESKVRLMVKPVEQTAFNRLLADMDTIPHVIEQHQANHYAYADVSISALLRTKQERSSAHENLDLGSPLSSLMPFRFSGYDQFYPMSRQTPSDDREAPDELRTAS